MLLIRSRRDLGQTDVGIYGEFDVDSDGNLQLSIACDLANEMRFSFKKLRFTCKKRKGLLR